MIEVLAGGIASSVQDQGRSGYRNFGVPVSGAMDLEAMQWANLLVGNHPNEPVFEICMGGFAMQFNCDIGFCIAGADYTAKLDTETVRMHSYTMATAGQQLRLGKLKSGFRAYIAFEGGLKLPKIMGSTSWYRGITAHDRLSKGMRFDLKCKRTKEEVFVPLRSRIKYGEADDSHFIRAFKGVEYDLLSRSQQEQLQSTWFTITSESNRMGYRLRELIVNNLPAIQTSGVLPGTVQLTPGGGLIVLMRDAQVTGGYPRVLQLSDSAINRLAQRPIGTAIRFVIQK
ncbi:Allophanate hydrolase [Tenacibaculum litopenaei]|uniref:5-oxoprolinase subunit C family protein n=1 Tax=Tenacibaculum litopenaei TaxID=396016 RepID=UPI00389657AB